MERRGYQLDCLQALKAAFEGGAGEGLFVLATGLGKTFTAIMFVAWALRQSRMRLRRTRPRVLVLCHQNGILSQLRDEFESHLGDEFTYGVLNSVEDRPVGEVDFLFSTFQTMTTARESFGSDYFDFLLVDEGHHSAATSFAETILFFAVTFRLAMTATPNRMDMKDIRVLFGPELYSKRLVEALAERLVPRVRYKVFIERSTRLADLLHGRKPTKRILEEEYFRANPSEARNEEVAGIIARHHLELGSPQLLVFCQNIGHCEEFVELLEARGISAAAVHSNLSHDENERRIARFKAGTLPALVARDILNEGKDLPAVRLIAAVRTTGSLTVFEQQIGRGLRPGKPELVFLDFVANCERMALISQVVNDTSLMHQEWLSSTRAAVHAGGDATGGTAVNDEDDPIVVESGDVSFIEELRELAGILGEVSAPWTRESALEGIRRLAAHLGKDTLSTSDLQRGSREGFCPSLDWLREQIDPEGKSPLAAIEAAGLQTRGKRKIKWTRDSALTGLRELSRQLGRTTISTRDFFTGSSQGLCPGHSWFLKNFGSQGAALAAAGLQMAGVEREHRRWTKEAALEGLRLFAERLGRTTLSGDDIRDASKAGICPSEKWLAQQFDPEKRSCHPALKAAGLESTGHRQRKWTREEGLDALKRLSETVGSRPLLQTDINWASREGLCPSHVWYREKFGTVAAAIQQVGATGGRVKWKRPEAVVALRAYATKLGRTALTWDDIRRGSKERLCPSLAWLRKEFGSVTNAFQAAGVA